jgi:imidazolonepropionase-like amidohydrolase
MTLERTTVPSPQLSRRRLLASAAAGALAACARGALTAEQPPARPTGPLALTRARSAGPDGLTAATVVVDGGRIVAADIDAEIPGDATLLDLTGLTLLPGFIDAHVHVQFADAAAVLAGGVTTVRDLGSPPDARAEERDSALRLLVAGRILTPVGGYPSTSWGADGTAREVDGEADARDAVAEQLADGASVIKVALEEGDGLPLFRLAVLDAVVTAAHDAGVAVTAHVGSPRALDLALDHGVDELAHLPLYDVAPADARRAAQAGLALVPTLAIRGRDPGAAAAVAAFTEAGGRIVYGTDLGNGGTSPGIMRGEVEALLDAGLSPADVLAAATSDAADYLGLPDTGRVEAGQRADLVAVAGDPLSDPAAYDDVRLVLAGGRVVLYRVSPAS